MLSVEKPDFYELPDGRFIGFVIGFSSAFRLERHCRAVFFMGALFLGGWKIQDAPNIPLSGEICLTRPESRSGNEKFFFPPACGGSAVVQAVFNENKRVAGNSRRKFSFLPISPHLLTIPVLFQQGMKGNSAGSSHGMIHRRIRY